MKNDTAINSSWRKFKTSADEKLDFRTPLRAKMSSKIESDGEVKSVKLSGSWVNKQKRTKGVAIPPSASKFHHNQKLIDTKFNQQTELNSLTKKVLYQKNTEGDEWKELEKSLTSEDLEIVGRFTGDINMARNLNPATARKFDLDITGTRRMSVDFARIISKIAEDNSGKIIDGSDFLDMNKLINRTIDKRSIFNCKSSRELESIVLLLDSSPSCEREAQLYTELASVAANFDDVDMYNAPNARITHRYKKNKRKFLPCFELEDIKNNAQRWSYFKNRVIMFFGDFDGISVVLKGTHNNKVYWFCTEYEDDIQYELDNHYTYNATNLTVYANITSKERFLNAIKKIR